MVYIRTLAYNAENTIRRAVDSVLNQTYTEFIFHILDNGSTDSTGQILREYAEKDSRIKLFSYKVNNVPEEGNEEFRFAWFEKDPDDIHVVVDSDDEIYPTFLEDTISFMNENKLDIVISRYEMINTQTGEIAENLASLKSDAVFSREDISSHFCTIFQIFRAMWAKAYKGKVFKPWFTKEEEASYPGYGRDTVQVLKTISNASRIGILNKVLYKYYLSPKSSSYHFNPSRLLDNAKMFKFVEKFLCDVNASTLRNQAFMCLCFIADLRDTVDVIFNTEALPLTTKLDYCMQLFSEEWTMNRIISTEINVFSEQKKQWMNQIIAVVLKYYNLLPDSAAKQYNSKFREVTDLLLFYRDFNYPNIPEQIQRICSVKFCYKHLGIMSYITEKNYSAAYSEFIETDISEVSQEELPAFFTLGQILSAVSEDMSHYIEFTKKIIMYEIENHDYIKAEEILSDFDIIMPNDADFKMFRILINDKKSNNS